MSPVGVAAALSIPILAAVAMAIDEQAIVRVHVTDGYGDAIKAPRIEISGAAKRLEVKQDEVVALPYGVYSVRVVDPDSSPQNSRRA